MKKLIIGLVLVGSMFCITGCGNKDLCDMNYTFDTALVRWPDGSMKEIMIRKWCDYPDGEQIQVIGRDGNIYLINSVNAVLIRHN